MASSSLFGGSSSNHGGSDDIAIPDFNEDDYLDLSSALLDDQDGSENGAAEVPPPDLAVSEQQQQQQQQQQEKNSSSNGSGSSNSGSASDKSSSDAGNNEDSQSHKASSPAHDRSSEGEHEHEHEQDEDIDDGKAADASYASTNANTSTVNGQQPHAPASKAPSTGPVKPVSGSAAAPNDSQNASTTFQPPPGNSNSGSVLNGSRNSPSSAAPGQAPRPPSPSKRSPTRNGSLLANIPEEEEAQHARGQQRQGITKVNCIASSTAQGLGSGESREQAAKGPLENGTSQVDSGQLFGQAGQQQQQGPQQQKPNLQMLGTLPKYMQNDNDTAAVTSPTFHSAPLKAPLAGPQAQAAEIRRHMFALQIPTLLLVNAELVKGCIHQSEAYHRENVNQAFPMDDPYKELLHRLSSNLGYLAALTGTAGPTNGSLPSPILEAPSDAGEYLKKLYAQLKTYFLMGQKSGIFGSNPPSSATIGPKSENLSPASSQQGHRPDSPSKQISAKNEQPELTSAATVTGKRDRQQTETEQQGDQAGAHQPDAKREKLEGPTQGAGNKQEDFTSPAKSAPLPSQPGQWQPQQGQIPQTAGPQFVSLQDQQQQAQPQAQAQQNTLQAPQPAQQTSTSSQPASASTSQPSSARRRKASQDSSKSGSRPQTPRTANQQQPQYQRGPQQGGQASSSAGPGDQSSQGSASEASQQQQQSSQLQQSSQPSSSIPVHIQQHLQATAAAQQSPSSPGMQGFPQQPQQARPPSSMSMQSPMSQGGPAAGTPQHFRHPSQQPATPMSSSLQQQQMQNGQFQPPRPPTALGQQQQQATPGYSNQPLQAGSPPNSAMNPQFPQQQQQQLQGVPGAPQNSNDMLAPLAHEMMRLQGMMQSARQFKMNHDLYGKMPPEAKQQLEVKLAEQENQFNQMKMAYERHVRQQGGSGAPNGADGQQQQQTGRAMSPVQQGMQPPGPRQNTQQPRVPPGQQHQQQRQPSISQLQQQAVMNNASSPAQSVHSIHDSPHLGHSSPAMVINRPGTSQSHHQNDGSMPPPRPIVPQHTGEAGSPAPQMQQTMQQQQQRPPFGQTNEFGQEISSPARPASVMSNSGQPHFRAPSVNAYHAGAASNESSPHVGNFPQNAPPQSPAMSGAYTAGSPVTPAQFAQMQQQQQAGTPGPQNQGQFNLMQQRARMASMQGGPSQQQQFQQPRPPTPSQQQGQGPPKQQGTPQQGQQQLPPQQQGQLTQQQIQQMQQMQQMQQQMHQGGRPGGLPLQIQIPQQLYGNPQAIQAYIQQQQLQQQQMAASHAQTQAQAQAQAQGRAGSPQGVPGSMGPPPSQQQPQYAQGLQQPHPNQQLPPQPGMGGTPGPTTVHVGGRTQGQFLPGIPMHLFPNGFNPNNPNHHASLRNYQQQMQQQEQMAQLQRLQQAQGQGPGPGQGQVQAPGPAGSPAPQMQMPMQMQGQAGPFMGNPNDPQYQAAMMRQQQQQQQQHQMMLQQQAQQSQRMRQASGAAQPHPQQQAQQQQQPQRMPSMSGQPGQQGFNPAMMQGQQAGQGPMMQGGQPQGQTPGPGQQQQQQQQQRPMFPYGDGQGQPNLPPMPAPQQQQPGRPQQPQQPQQGIPPQSAASSGGFDFDSYINIQ